MVLVNAGSAHTSRRAIVRGSIAALFASQTRAAAQSANAIAFSLPIGLPGRARGDGFFIRHGYSCENSWYNPGAWHTGEDWYLIDGDTAGAEAYAVADGQVVFSDSDYPGRVVIVEHAADLFSTYGHLGPELDVQDGDDVARGQRLGVVLNRTDGLAPSHLHFEMRTFLTTPKVNGDAPQYGFACGVNCPPGPGYWPIDAPELPSAMGWRNPTHTLFHRMFTERRPTRDAELVVPQSVSGTFDLWSAPTDHADAVIIGSTPLRPGDRLRWISVATGPEASVQTSAEGYRLWVRIDPSLGKRGWMQAAIASTNDTGTDGRPSSIWFNLLPALPE